MATPTSKTSPASVKSASGTSKTPGLRLDLASIFGIALAMLGIVGGLILEKGSIQDVAQGTAAMIVLGGTFGAVLVTTPMATILRAFRGIGAVFFDRGTDTRSELETIIQFAAKARKHGIVSLEVEASELADPFLRKSLGLAVDGTDLTEIRKMMEIDIAMAEHNAEAEAKVWDAAGGYAPTIGIIGAVMGLIQVMKHLEDIKEVGHGIAVAFVATVYGVSLANIFFIPAATKLRTRMNEATLRKDMILEGVIGIVEGLNPTLIRMKLDAYLPTPTAKVARAGKPVAARPQSSAASTEPASARS
jgi:chemotaxis protein MotA